MKRNSFMILSLAILLMISCTASVVDVSSCLEAEPSGFWMGAWHGVIAPITFIISLFTDTLQMYDINNNGAWYDFGFVLGAGILFGGSGSGARRRRKKRRKQD